MIDPDGPDFENTPASDRRPRFDYGPAGDVVPLTSIITPFFNAGPEFNETATSVLGQSLQQWEWLIVNDGSDDQAALDRLAPFRGGDIRIRVIDLPTNRGLAAARNTGVREARTTLVLHLDCGDLLEPTTAEKWFWYLDTHPSAGFVTGYTVGFGDRQYLWTKGFHEGCEFLRTNLVDATALVRRDVHAAAGGYDDSNRDGLEDWQFWLACANAGHWGGMVDEYLVWYRRRADHAQRWANWDDGERQQRFLAGLRARFPRLWEGAFPQLPVEPGASEPIRHDWAAENLLHRSARRLLLIVPWMAIGGADRFNLDLIRELVSRGWEVSIATTRPDDDVWLPQFTALTPDVFALHRFLPMADYPRFLAYLISSRQVETVMVSHSEMGYRLLPYLRSRFAGVTFTDYTHVVEPSWNQGGYPRFAIDYADQLDLSIVSSDHLRQWMTERGADGNRIRVCHTNVDTTAIHPDVSVREAVRQERGVAADDPVILFAGRLCEQKQPLLMLEVLTALRARGVRFVAWVVGAGPESMRMQDAIHRLGLQKQVRMLGAVPPPDVGRLMSAADLLFLPSAYEGIALVLFEAMAAGLPVVAADVGGHREVVTPECGVLVTPVDRLTDAAAYTDALAALLQDPERRARLARHARERVLGQFQVEQMGTRMVELLDEATELRRHRPQPRPTVAEGLSTAATAVELARLWELSIRLWNERSATTMGERVYLELSRRLSPLYEWGIQRGWRWIPALGMRVRTFLIGRSTR